MTAAKDWMAEDMEATADRAAEETQPDFAVIGAALAEAKALGAALTPAGAEELVARGQAGIPLGRPELLEELRREIFAMVPETSPG